MVAMATSNRSPAGSARSSRTSASSVSTAHARADAEAAKVRASYASQEAKLQLEKAAREAERATRDAQNKLETTRIDTELEVLTLHREADAAMVTAQVLEDAEAMQSVVEDGKSESEKVKINASHTTASCHGVHLWKTIHNYNLSAGKMLRVSNRLHQNYLTQLKLRQRLRLVEPTPP